MHKLILPFAAACALTAISIITAHAHGSAETSQAAAGSHEAVQVAQDEAHDHHAGAADTVKAGDLEIKGAWARAMLPGQPTGGAYLTITNSGANADRLLGAASPNAGKVEIHTMSMKDDVMVMRPLADGLEIPAGASVELKSGGEHLMFMNVTEPFMAGASVPVTLEFEKAGKVDLNLPVQAKAGGEDHSNH
jgi:copper(I)-binding protein